jgi:acetolactate synthase-1/2/3 large subunit
MKVISFIAQFLKSKGIDTVFELQGGMITRIIDELYKDGNFTIVSMHHEQAAAMAADAFGRIRNIPGVALATSGPGATNLITGIGNCYFDSVPAIFITGQVNVGEQKGDRPIRQLGFQETDIVSVAKPLTKAAYAVTKGNEIPAIFEEAYRISTEGRPGPVLIDIPMNVQHEECEMLSEVKDNPNAEQSSIMDEYVQNLFNALSHAKAPLLLAGRGVQTANVQDLLLEFSEKYHIPVVTSLNALDIIPHDHSNRFGFIGSYGNRWANYAMGTCDVLIAVGSRLDLRQTGVDITSFQSNKKIFHIDIEKGELGNRFKESITLHANIKDFLKNALGTDIVIDNSYEDWFTEIAEKRRLWPDTNELKAIDGLNPNAFVHRLAESSSPAKAYTADVGSHQMWVSQSIKLKEHQAFLTSGGMGAMGYSLPAAIGACFALKRLPVVSISGDGGFQINIQELQTIRRNNLPIKIVILNNHCLGMIRQFQDAYFESNYASTVWGYSAPDFVEVAKAYGIKASRIIKEDQIENELNKMWDNPNEPYLLDVSFDIHTNVYPKMMFGNPITKMEPLLD